MSSVYAVLGRAVASGVGSCITLLYGMCLRVGKRSLLAGSIKLVSCLVRSLWLYKPPAQMYPARILTPKTNSPAAQFQLYYNSNAVLTCCIKSILSNFSDSKAMLCSAQNLPLDVTNQTII